MFQANEQALLYFYFLHFKFDFTEKIFCVELKQNTKSNLTFSLLKINSVFLKIENIFVNVNHNLEYNS